MVTVLSEPVWIGVCNYYILVLDVSNFQVITMLSEWNVTIAGAVLCIVFSWFLGVVSRSQGVQFGKIGPIVGIVGVFILAGMGVTGPPQHASLVRDNSVQSVPKDTIEKLRLVYEKTREKRGPRPGKNYIAYEDPTGKLAWVTMSEYRTLHLQKKER